MNFWMLFLVCGWIGHKPVDGLILMKYQAKNDSFEIMRCSRCRMVYWEAK